MPDDPKSRARAKLSTTAACSLSQGHVSRACIERSRQLLIKTEPQRDPYRIQLDRNAISITQIDDEWHVLVEQIGQHLVSRSFGDERHAENYAESQRVRLGLQTVTRI